jgi:predicted peptidase
MTPQSMAVLFGALLMAKSGDPIKVQPGKQVPQTLTVHLPESGESTIRYLLFVPREYEPDGKKWPLLLFLHGLGECSDRELDRVKIHGPPKIVESQPDFPFIVVSPQLPPPAGYKEGAKYTYEELHRLVDGAWKPEPLITLVDHVANQLHVDQSRIYVTGLSMGGYGTWRLVAAHHERFAAAVPICGGGEPEKMAKPLARVPIWAFHGAKDTVVLLSESEKIVDAVKRAGGDVKLTVYPDVEHNSWGATYDNPEVLNWLLAHQKR